MFPSAHDDVRAQTMVARWGPSVHGATTHSSRRGTSEARSGRCETDSDVTPSREEEDAGVLARTTSQHLNHEEETIYPDPTPRCHRV